MDKNTNKQEELWWHKPLMLFSEMSAWIAFPVIIAVFLGQWLDERYQTKPWLFLLTVLISFCISIFGIIKSAIQSINQIENINSDNKKIKEKKNGK